MFTPLSEAEIIEGIELHSAPAISACYDRYAAMLYKIIWITVKDKELACELLEKTFLAICEEIPKAGIAEKGFSLWMAGIAKNMALSSLKTRQIKESTSAEDPLSAGLNQLAIG